MASTILNKELFVHDPTRHSLQNDGVSKVDNTATIQYELETFVCDGEYKAGLDRMLSTYLSHLDAPNQPSVWVSGFYGSGKSHLVKILEALWTNKPMLDGRSPRDIVRIPRIIQDHLRELSSEARRKGGLWSASGMLTGSDEQSVRMLILGIVYKAAGLSSNYGRSRFRLWVRKHGWEYEITRRILAAGYEVEEEFNNYLVSHVIADAVHDLSRVVSMDVLQIQDRWEQQFDRTDVSIDEMLEALGEVLKLQSEDQNQVPLTLIVLDEVQQYIGETGDRAQAVQQVAERIQTAFDSRVLLVATGQAALSSTPNLQKLQDRFTVNVMLNDKDVERVVREVVLLKKPEVKPAVDAVIGQVEGEIDRHLNGTKFGPKSEDKEVLVADYPLLPTRGRFWADLLHRLDPTGTTSQLRSQLRVVHGANLYVADRPLGQVIPADFIFEQLQNGLLQSGVLPRDIATMIDNQRDGTDDGKLRARLLQLIFLIERLSTHDLNSSGLTATAANLADLLVVDLKEGSADLRRRIPALLNDLEEAGSLLLIDGAYFIQTGESQKWQSTYQEQRSAVVANPAPLGELRTRELERIVREQTRSIRQTQGDTNEPRQFQIHYGNDAPSNIDTTSNVVVWVRDGWIASRTTVVSDARGAGDASPIIYVFLPQMSATEIQSATADHYAAKMTLEIRGSATDIDGGQQAADAMRSRMDSSERHYKGMLKDVVADAQVFQGGGAEVEGDSFTDKIRVAFEGSLKRLFPKFSMGDESKWDNVFTRASDGSSDPLGAIGYRNDESSHPVVREVRQHIPGGTGVSWSSVRATFRSAPYGWPNDTIDGAIAVLVNSSSVIARRDGKEIRGKSLIKQQASQTTLVGESETVSKNEFIAARTAFLALYEKSVTDDEVRAGALDFRDQVFELVDRAGGEPPRPLSTPPAYLADLRNMAGNTLLKAIAAKVNQLTADIKQWRSQAASIQQRAEEWETLQHLASHATSLEDYGAIAQSITAIRDGRQLLDEPNPLTPVQQSLGKLLREALADKIASHNATLDAGLSRLTGNDDWLRLDEGRRDAILQVHRLKHADASVPSSDRELAHALDRETISLWDDRIAAIDGRIDNAMGEVARILEPTTVDVTVSGVILRKPIDVTKWLEENKEALMKHVQEGHPVRVR